MIIGIGTDLVEVSRFEKEEMAMRTFLNRFYGEEERMQLEKNGFKKASIAANFAGKEAVLKVFGTGLRDCRLDEIQILRDSLGKPFVRLSGGAKALAIKKDIDEIFISLSHTKEHAIAYAVGTKERK